MQRNSITQPNDGTPESARNRVGAPGLQPALHQVQTDESTPSEAGSTVKRSGVHAVSTSSLAACSVPDYDQDYQVMAKVPPEDAFERHAPRLLTFLHSYAAHPNDARRKQKEQAVKRKWLDAACYQNPEGALYKVSVLPMEQFKLALSL